MDEDDDAVLFPPSPPKAALPANVFEQCGAPQNENEDVLLLCSSSSSEGDVQVIPIFDHQQATPKLRCHKSTMLTALPKEIDLRTSCRRTTRLSEAHCAKSAGDNDGAAFSTPVAVMPEAQRVLLFGSQWRPMQRTASRDVVEDSQSQRAVPAGTQRFSACKLPVPRTSASQQRETAAPAKERSPHLQNCHQLVVGPSSTFNHEAAGSPTPTASKLAQLWCPWESCKHAAWDLAGWGLPEAVCSVYRHSYGVTRLFPWQRACLFEYFSSVAASIRADACSRANSAAQQGEAIKPVRSSGSLLYSAPTSGGKTLVAEVIMLRRLLAPSLGGKPRKALFIVPYVSIAEEKSAALQAILQPVGRSARCHAGHKGQRSLTDDVLVCTPEKANILVNIMVEKKRIDEVCAVVVDELHQIADDNGGRGYLLEVLITKLVLLARQSQGEMALVGLSATLRNAEQLSSWMNDALLFVTDFRPVPLKEHCVCSGEVLDDKGRVVRRLAGEKALANQPPHVRARIEQRPYVDLARESFFQDAQALIFCPSRALCERSAADLVEFMAECARHAGGAAEGGPRLAAVAPLRRDLARRLRSGTTADDSTVRGVPLPLLVESGVAFHHAALTIEERLLIESGFREGSIWALCCTTTLATGVNLPARRVIFTAPRIAFQFLDAARYKQAAGRAGRMGLDAYGEAFLCCRPQERSLCAALISTALPPIQSNFSVDRKGLMRVLLEGITAGTVRHVMDIESTIRQTLLAVMSDYGVVFRAAKDALEFLEVHQFVEWDTASESFHATLLGVATVNSALAPDEALMMMHSLEQARHHFVFASDLHLVFFCTPIYHGIEPDWARFCHRVSRLPPECQAIAALLGISEGYLAQCAAMPPPRHLVTAESVTHRRFYGSLILLDAVREAPWSQVTSTYQIPKQELQRLMESAATFAAMTSTFCESLNWWQFAPLFHSMATRLQCGVEPDLVPLMKIPGLAPWRARELFKRGFRTVLSIAAALPQELESSMSVRAPFEVQRGEFQEDTQHRARGVKDLVAMLQRGARAALAEEAAELQDSINELNTVVGPLRAAKRERSPSALPTEQPVDVAVAVSVAVAVRYTFLHPATSDERWSEVVDGLLLQAEHVSVVGVTPLTTNHPVLMLCVGSRTDYHPHIVVLDDGCTKTEGSLPALERRQHHRSMRFFVEALLKTSAVTKSMSDAKQLLRDLIRGGWLAPVGDVFSNVHSLCDVSIGEWLLAPEDRSASGHQMTIRTVADRLGVAVDERSVVFIPQTDGDDTAARSVGRLLFSAAGTSAAGEGLGPLRRQALELLLLHKVAERVRQRLREAELHDHFVNVEMRLAVCLAVMESHGIPFVSQDYEIKAALMKQKALALQEEAYRIAGRTRWSLSSPRDCAMVLFDVLKLPSLGRTFDSKYLPHKGGKKRRERLAKESRSTKGVILNALSNMFPECRLPAIIREHRTMCGWLEKYIEPLLWMARRDREAAAEARSKLRTAPPRDEQCAHQLQPSLVGVSRIFGQFLLTATATGRLAMNDPNLQTIPHPITFTLSTSAVPRHALPFVRILDNDTAEIDLKLRQAFVASPGHVLLSVDYCQIEARLLAHFSGDPKLLSRFTQETSTDIFVDIAADIFKKDPLSVSKDERKQAKTLTYAMLYGKGKSSLADDLEIEEEEAEHIMKQFRDTYATAHNFLNSVALEAQSKGYVETITKRKRWLPYASSAVPKFRAASARIAVNTLCQGSAADLVKRAMLRLCVLHEFQGSSPRARLLLQIHDELLIESAEDVARSVAARVAAEMTAAAAEFADRVAFPVRVSIGPNWADLVEVAV